MAAQLPPEIITMVMADAVTTDLAVFCLVCKSWLRTARRLLYRVLDIDVERPKLSSQQLLALSPFVRDLRLWNLSSVEEEVVATQFLPATDKNTLQSLGLFTDFEHEIDVEAVLKDFRAESLTYRTNTISLARSTALFKSPSVTETLCRLDIGDVDALPCLAPASLPSLSHLRVSLYPCGATWTDSSGLGFASFLRAFESLEVLGIETSDATYIDAFDYGDIRTAISANRSPIRELWLSPLSLHPSESVEPFSWHQMTHLKHLRLDSLAVTRSDLLALPSQLETLTLDSQIHDKKNSGACGLSPSDFKDAFKR